MTDVRRPRRTRQDLRELLVQSALVEFAEHGFEGASTRSIAQRVDAHQPQINYHFATKEALWEAAVDHLFAELVVTIDPIDPADFDDAHELAAAFAHSLRQFVRFAAKHPELNRIMLHESTSESDRLRWMVDRHIRALYDTVRHTWVRLLDAGISAPIDAMFVHYVIVGAASLPFVNAPEARLLTDVDPMDDVWVERHANGIIATLLPGL
jgi:AcrR family transcriptional regulator